MGVGGLVSTVIAQVSWRLEPSSAGYVVPIDPTTKRPKVQDSSARSLERDYNLTPHNREWQVYEYSGPGPAVVELILSAWHAHPLYEPYRKLLADQHTVGYVDKKGRCRKFSLFFCRLSTLRQQLVQTYCWRRVSGRTSPGSFTSTLARAGSCSPSVGLI